MAPKEKDAAFKQKSLTSFFSKTPIKPAGAAATSTSRPTPTAKSQSTSKLSSHKPLPREHKSVGEDIFNEPHTPSNSQPFARGAGASSRVPSSISSKGGSTPPTSDIIDVDDESVLDAHENADVEMTGGRVKSAIRKRKIVIDDSDEEGEADKIGNIGNSSPIQAQGRTKRQRLSLAPSFNEESEGEEDESLNTLSRRLSRFKKSPAKSKKGNSRIKDDDDDFIVASDDASADSDVGADARSVKSSSSAFSSRRSRRSSLSASSDVSMESLHSSFEDDDEEPRSRPSKSRTKPAPKAKKTPANRASAGGSGGGGGGFTFMTAAEQREQGKKNEKKATEDPYTFLQDVRDKDGKRPGEPGYDPRTLYIPPGAWKEFTPFEKQFWEIKQNHYDTILFFQKGKFFELYEDDARIGHQEFDLKLTSRVKMSMVGVPEMAFNFWAAKFLGKGYKVGRVDQSETALGAEMRVVASKIAKGKATKGADDKAKEKIVRRELNKVYTNGTLVDPELLTDEQAGHCIAIAEISLKDHDESGEIQQSQGRGRRKNQDMEVRFGVCVLDCSTSQFDLSAFDDDICRTRLETLMRQVRPKEVLFKKGTLSVTTQRTLKAVLPAHCLWTGLRDVEGYGYEQTLERLKAFFPDDGKNPRYDGNMDLDDGEGVSALLPKSVPKPIRQMVDSPKAIEALGCMIWYLRQLNIDKDIVTMRNFNIYDPMKRGQGLVLEGQSLAHLEIFLNSEGTEDGTLLKLLGRCITPFGKRLFRIWLCMPLRDVSAINARLDAVQDIMDHPSFEAEFASVAKGLPDLERIVARIHGKGCKVKDFLKVLSAFKRLSRGLSKLADEAEGFNSKTILGLLRNAPDLIAYVKNIEDMFQRPTGEKDWDELLPQKGKNVEYDKIVGEITELEKELKETLEELEEEVGYKLAYWHSAIGNKDIYLVEVPAGKKVPSSWAKNRYIVPSLQSKIRTLKEARENRTTAIKDFKYRLFTEFDADRGVWLRAIRVFAELDCLFSLAKSSEVLGAPMCRPEFVENEDHGSAFVEFEELRHPTLSLSAGVKSFVANDVKMGGKVGKVALLTGPNMAGKSTLMRMTAVGVIMAQLGMFVPAAKARLSPVDAIITRMGAYDNMFSHASTFKVELDECCKILRDATPNSLVILDELGRGTSTYDGMAIAGAVLHQLATHTLPLTFFATHYGSLTDDFAYHPNIRNMHMSTLVDDERKELVFLYKLIEGVAESSFGTHVANLAGVPFEVVERADSVSKEFAKQFKERMALKQKKNASSKVPLTLQADFVYLFKLGSGQISLPSKDQAKGKEVLMRLKTTVQTFLGKA